jgi:ribosomal protein S18 acetylase RimI-like enzyme
MTPDDFNLEDEYGGLLDLLEEYIAEAEPTVEHFGVKGMKWGVRKDRPAAEPLKSLGPDSVSRKTKTGETITLQKVQASKFQEFLGRHSKGFREEYSKQASLNILDSSGKKVGDAMVQKRSKDELYLEWLGIKKSERGKGYASAVMKAGRDFGKQEGFKKMVLEVPGNSPDARHIYENLGFKYVGEVDGGHKDPIWGGLSKMEYDFDEVKHGELTHYGVKGMRWGHRKARPGGVSRSTDRMARKDAKEFARAKQFYGEGAGTRRKLIKARVDGISKKNPGYKKAFDAHLANQDTSKHASKAKSERKRKNVANSTRKGIRGTSHILRGNSQYASAATAIVVGGALYAHKAGIDKTILNAGKSAYSKAKDPNGHKAARNLLRDMGIG